MGTTRAFLLSTAWIVISTTSLNAGPELSTYRGFQFGMSVTTVARHAGISPEPRIVHQRPELIQELMLQPPPSLGPSPSGDSVRKILFSFYNGELFRIVINYDWDKTEGLTVEDMVEAVSVRYGPAMLPLLPATPILALSKVDADSDRIMAHWEDAQSSVDLFQPSYASTFGLVVFSKRLDALAQSASIEAARLDAQDAPTRAIDRKQKQEDDDGARQQKARLVNKATFRP
jgi:hypothetical protein